MKRNSLLSIGICIVAFAFMLPFKAQSQHLSWQWVTVAHGLAEILPNGITPDNDDNVIVCGQTKSGRTFFQNDTLYGHGDIDVFIAKYDGSGVLNWLKNPGGSGMEFANSVCTDSNNNIYVTGGFSGGGMRFENDSLPCRGDFDMFLAKYDPNGKQLWVRHLGGIGREIGNIIRYDPNGFIICEWYCPETQYIQIGNDSLYQTGPYVITKFTTDGNLAWSKPFPSYITRMEINNNGGIITSGFIDETIIVQNDTITKGVFVAKTDFLGNLVWYKHADGKQIYGLTSDINNNVYCAGSYQKSAVIFGTLLQQFEDLGYFYFAKLDSIGNTTWVKNFEPNGNAGVSHIATNNNNEILLNGASNGSEVDFGNGLKFNKVPNQLLGFNALSDSSGSIKWIEASTLEAWSMRYHLPNTFVIAGRINNNEKLGGLNIIRPYNSQAIYLAKSKEQEVSSVRSKYSDDKQIFTAIYRPESDELTLWSGKSLHYPCTIRVYDVLGKMVKSSTFNSGDAQKLTIEANDLSNGAYSLEITSEHQSASSKVMIVK